jgi:hypothetical protein
MFENNFNLDPDKAPHIVQKQMLIEALKPTGWSINKNGWIATGSALI